MKYFVHLEQWEPEDTRLLIQWCAVESVYALERGRSTDASALHLGVAAVLRLLAMAVPYDRAGLWLDWRLSQVCFLLREQKRTGSTIDVGALRESLALITTFSDSYSDVQHLDEEPPLPEHFDENEYWFI